MNKNVLLVVLIVMVLGAGYSLYKKEVDKRITTIQQAATPPIQKPKKVLITLTQQNNSYESGTATLIETKGSVTVTLKLSGAPNKQQPAHIHTGSCPSPGVVLYSLTPVTNGQSVTTLSISMNELFKQKPLAINVHKSAEEAKTYVACGNAP